MNCKNIILGITGGVAAYKSAELVRRLREHAVNVRVVMTQAAQAFITPLTLQALSGNPVHTDLFDASAEAAMGHIELARFADLVLVAPASADFIARLAHGHANDLLATLCLATLAPIVLAPAMNQQMWSASITQENIEKLIKRGVKILGPDSGSQACGDVGFGRMLEVETIIDELVKKNDNKLLKGKHIVITAGPTQEAIDPVRYLTNHSSGKMGYALAEAAFDAGASVTLISGPVTLKVSDNINILPVVSAEDMFNAVMDQVKNCDVFVSAAAVVDYRMESIAQEKMKKTADHITLKLIKTPDILKQVAGLKKRPFCIGFAAETNDYIENAKEKLKQKHLDMIIANEVGKSDRGFNVETNSCTVLTSKEQYELPLMQKKQLAQQLIEIIARNYHAKCTS